MSGQGPSPDAFRKAIVFLSFRSVEDVKNPDSADYESLYSSASDLSLPFTLEAHDYIQSFEFEFSESASWRATFTIFDPTFRILDYIIKARADPESVRVYFRFGWIVDGQSAKISTPREGVVFDFEPTIMQSGIRVILHVYQTETRIRETLRIPNLAFGEGAPAHIMVREVMENASLTGTTRDAVTVDTPVKTKPVRNNGSSIVIKDEEPIKWIKSWLIPRTEADNEQIRGPFRLFENEEQPGLYVFAPEGFRNTGDGAVKPKRTYHVGRARSGQVRSFSPTDVSQFANLIAGEGYTRGVASANRSMSVSARSGIGADTTDIGSEVFDQNRVAYKRFSFDRDPLTQDQRRRVMWNTAQALALNVEAEIMGDPFLYVNDYLVFLVYHGATIALAGRSRDTLDSRIVDSPQIVTPLSGLYVVLGYKHSITETGDFTTQLQLTKARNSTVVSDLQSAFDIQQSTVFVDPSLDVNHTDDAKEAAAAKVEEQSRIRRAKALTAPRFGGLD